MTEHPPWPWPPSNDGGGRAALPPADYRTIVLGGSSASSGTAIEVPTVTLPPSIRVDPGYDYAPPYMPLVVADGAAFVTAAIAIVAWRAVRRAVVAVVRLAASPRPLPAPSTQEVADRGPPSTIRGP